MCWRTVRRIAALAAAALALGAAPAHALTLVPPKGSVFWGVSDRGNATEFNEFAALLGKHPALLETFHPWGNSLNKAYERWRETGTRPILHISTANDQTLAEMITPRQIALGGGDNYLLQLNTFSGAANTRPAGTSRPSAGSPRSCAAGPPWKGSTRRSPKSAYPRSTGPRGRTRPPCRWRR